MVPLVFSQLVPPRIKNAVQREHLLKLGSSILSYQVTLVTAPAGFGKSVWVASLLDGIQWPSTAWLSLDHYDSESAYVLYHIIYAFQRVFPDIGTSALRTMNSLENASRDWEIALASILEELPQEQETVLVLDDYHLIFHNPEVNQIIEQLIYRMPPQMHLIIMSRTRPSLNLYRQQLRGQLLEIDSNNLRFTKGESRQLFEQLEMHLTDLDLDKVHMYTEGWPAALRLLGVILQQSGSNLHATLNLLKGQGSSLYTYLSDELMAYLPASLQQFLLGSSLLPYLEPNLCEASLQVDNSLSLITELHSRGLLSGTEETNKTWRLHHLMGDFLQHKVHQEFAPLLIAGIRQRTAQFMENKGDIDRALEQRLTTLDWKEASRTIREYGDSYFLKSGLLNALNAWINRIPDQTGYKDHWVYYFEGMSLLHVNQELALSTLSHAARQAEALNDIRCQVRSLLAMIAAYTFANNVRKIEETARRMPPDTALAQDTWSQGAVSVASLSKAAWVDDLHQGVAISRQVVRSNLDAESHMAYLMFSSIIQYRLGNLDSAKSLINEAILDPYVQENERWAGTSYVICGIIYWLSGEHQKLEDICTEILHLGSKYKAPHQLGNAHRRLAHLYLLQGRLAEARREFELSRSSFLEGNNIFFSYLTDLDLIWVQIQAGESARDLLPESQRIIKVLSGLWGGQGLDDYALSLAGIIALEANDLGLAAGYLKEVVERCTAKGSRQILAGAQMLLARIKLLQGQEQKADFLLKKALSSAESENWEFFWDWHPESIYYLCRRALIKRIHPTWAAHMLRRWFAQRIFKEAGYFLANSDAGVSSTFAEMVHDLAKSNGKAILHVNFLGGFQVHVNGQQIPASAWKTKKAENLLKFLLSNRQTYNKETIAAILWPEAEQNQADASLRMALSHVRKALGLKAYGLDTVVVKRGMVYLNLNLDIYTDYELFNSLAQQAFQRIEEDTPQMIELLEQARDLYRGGFLPENLYDDWTSDLRRQLHDTYRSILKRLLVIFRLQGHRARALDTCRLYLTLDPCQEEVCRTAMQLLWEDGQKEQALHMYQELAASLDREYGIIPHEDTLKLYSKIRQ